MKAFERTTLLVEPEGRRCASHRPARCSSGGLLRDRPRTDGVFLFDACAPERIRVTRGSGRSASRVPAAVGRLDIADYGRPQRSGLLPRGKDALTQALDDMAPEWTVARLVVSARAAAVEADDYSLVGLAARVEDAVVLTALRESVVLYAAFALLGGLPVPTFDWKVWESGARGTGEPVHSGVQCADTRCTAGGRSGQCASLL